MIKTICLDNIGHTFVSFRERDLGIYTNTIYEKLILFQNEIVNEGILFPAKSLELTNIKEIEKLRDFLTECIDNHKNQKK